jgi:hypothetical protein
LVAFSIHSTKHGHLWSSNKQEPLHFAMFFISLPSSFDVLVFKSLKLS